MESLWDVVHNVLTAIQLVFIIRWGWLLCVSICTTLVYYYWCILILIIILTLWHCSLRGRHLIVIALSILTLKRWSKGWKPQLNILIWTVHVSENKISTVLTIQVSDSQNILLGEIFFTLLDRCLSTVIKKLMDFFGISESQMPNLPFHV